MGRPRKIKSVEEMARLWAAYKAYCDTQSVLTHRLDYKSGEFISTELKRPLTYTIQGFCAFIGLARSNFYATYGKDKAYQDAITRAREECEADARQKFELGQIPPKLAKIWMGNYRYGRTGDKPLNESAIDNWINAVLDEE